MSVRVTRPESVSQKKRTDDELNTRRLATNVMEAIWILTFLFCAETFGRTSKAKQSEDHARRENPHNKSAASSASLERSPFISFTCAAIAWPFIRLWQ